MNGTEQRARSTAVSRIDARMTNVEEITEALAAELVATRDATRLMLETLDRRIDHVEADLARRLDALTADRDRRIAAWEALTRWERLRWLTRGHA